MRVFVVTAAAVSLLAPSFALAAPKSPPPPVAVEAPAKKPLPAPTPARLALARQVMVAYGGPEAINAIFDSMLDGLLKGVKPGPQILVIAAPYQERLVKSVHAHMPQMMEVMAVAWARTYDEQEMSAQLAYLQSPTSQSLVRKLPAITGDVGLEMGWFVRQLLLTDPKTSQYLADVTGAEEPPLSWPAPPKANMDALRDTIAESPEAAEFLLDPQGAIERADKKAKASGKRPAIPGPIEKRATALLPVLINDLLTIIANHVTPDELSAQKAFSSSPEGKAMSAKAKQVSANIGDDLAPILKEIFHDMMTPPQKA